MLPLSKKRIVVLSEREGKKENRGRESVAKREVTSPYDAEGEIQIRILHNGGTPGHKKTIVTGSIKVQHGRTMTAR